VVCHSILLGRVMLIGQETTVNLSSQEAAIRAVIAGGKISYTDDYVYWIGRYKRPSIW
jgi:hypothetical protein